VRARGGQGINPPRWDHLFCGRRERLDARSPRCDVVLDDARPEALWEPAHGVVRTPDRCTRLDAHRLAGGGRAGQGWSMRGGPRQSGVFVGRHHRTEDAELDSDSRPERPHRDHKGRCRPGCPARGHGAGDFRVTPKNPKQLRPDRATGKRRRLDVRDPDHRGTGNDESYALRSRRTGLFAAHRRWVGPAPPNDTISGGIRLVLRSGTN